MEQSISKEKIKHIILIVINLVMTIWFFLGGHAFDNGSFAAGRFIFLIFIIAVAFIVHYAPVVRRFIEDKSVYITIAFAILVPIISFWNGEVLYGCEPQKYGERLLLINFLIVFTAWGLIYMLTNSVRWSNCAILAIMFLWACANYYVYQFRGSPITAPDIYTIGTAMEVAGDFKYGISWNILRAAFVIVFIIELMFAVPKQSLNKRLRAIYCVCYIGLTAMFYGLFFQTDLVRAFGRIKVSYFKPHNSFHKRGSLAIFLHTVKKLQVEEPDGYDEEELSAWMADYIENQYEPKSGSEEKPNIIFIMDEAFSDFSEYIELTEDPMPFVRSMRENTIKGKMYSSVFSGFTANSEFEALTGNSKGFIPGQAVVYQMFMRREMPSLAWSLKANDYAKAVAFHPFKKNGYNRPKSYEYMDFDAYFADEDVDNPRYVREYISDERDFEYVINLYEENAKSSDKPIFIHNVTMQNHSGYTYEDYDATVQIKGHEGEYAEAEQYLSLTRETDKAVEKLISYFENVDDNTIIVFFGDHKPRLADDFYDFAAAEGGVNTKSKQQETALKYTVPYFIWANFDIEEKQDVNVSANYFSSIVTEISGIKQTPYQQYLSEIRETLPVISANGYFDKLGKFYELGDEDSPYYDIIEEYRRIQYNNVFGNRYDEFFYIQE